MLTAVFDFLLYFLVSAGLLALFIKVYVRYTPYDDLALIQEGNVAAAIALGGSAIGFVLPITSAIYFTHNLISMIIWAVICGCVQIVSLVVIDHSHDRFTAVKEGNIATALFIAALAVALGLLCAVCISF
jgi:putative membrane protein